MLLQDYIVNDINSNNALYKLVLLVISMFIFIYKELMRIQK